MHFTCLLPSTSDLGLSFWRELREPLLTQEPMYFLGHSPPQLSPSLATDNRAWLHLCSWTQGGFSPSCLGFALFHFPCTVSLHLSSPPSFVVIKYADKSNLRGRELISAQNPRLQAIIVEDIAKEARDAAAGTAAHLSSRCYIWCSLSPALRSSVPCLSYVYALLLQPSWLL